MDFYDGLGNGTWKPMISVNAIDQGHKLMQSNLQY